MDWFPPSHTSHKWILLKIMLPNTEQVTVAVFNNRTPKRFLSKVQTTLETIRQKGLLAAYNKACEVDKVQKRSMSNPQRL